VLPLSSLPPQHKEKKRGIRRTLQRKRRKCERKLVPKSYFQNIFIYCTKLFFITHLL